uniref:carboxylesterase n=1 Tax=Musca domestica TaxID=7370 RepID=T1PIM0_MUSDO
MTESELIVKTTLGPIKGRQCVGVYGHEFYSFEKIPFAEVPVGELRFRPPQPKQPWSEVLDCTQPAIKPLQKNMLTNQFEGSEDCLYLNIYTKQLKSEKPLPVIAFLFGGAFEKGDPTADLHGPDYFMMKDVIFVTIGYRLGPFGFMQFKDPELNAPGNNGFKDQLVALRWIKENIAKFNGNPDNITLSGESAGAAAAHYLMCCPLAKGLFHKAILMSGNILCSWAYLSLENIPYRLAKACGYEGPADNEKLIFEYLKQQPGENLLKPYVNTKEENLNDMLFTFGPCIEPYESDLCIINKHPEQMLGESWGNHIPVLMSGTSFEGLLMFPRVHMAQFLVTELENNPQHCLPLSLKSKYPADLQRVLGGKIKETHFGDRPATMENVMRYCEYATYKIFWHPIFRFIKARTAAAPTYLYRFDFDSPDFNHQRIKYCGKQMRGVAHVDDHSYLFYGNFSWKLSPETDEYKTIERMVDIWYSFAVQSNPNGGTIEKELLNGSSWLPVNQTTSVGNLKCLNINRDLAIIDLPEMKKLQVWESIYEEDVPASQ